MLHLVNSLINHKIHFRINFDQRISRSKAIVLVALLAVIMALSGYYIGEQWFWVKDQNLYEYRIESLKDRLAENSASTSVRVELAMTYYLDGQAEKAEGVLRKVLADEPENDTAVLYLGLILSEQKNYRESIAFLTRYLEKNQGLETRIALLYLGRNYLETGAIGPAVTTLSKAAEIDSANPVVYYYMGQAYEKLNDRQNAINAYERALAINNEYKEAELALKKVVGR
nr:tetratricopeptide repeat protein [Phosphitispora fastidiosa]